jgi:predicted trehalose synthase
MPTSSAILSLLTEWMPGQRWYAGKGRQPVLRPIGDWELRAPGAAMRVHLVLDEAARPPTLYQVPVSERTDPLASAEAAFIGQLVGDGGTRYLYDGPRDPAFAGALLHLLMHGGEASGHGMEVRGVSLTGDRGLEIRASRVHTGEQSNTSIVYEVARADSAADQEPERIVCKLFRAVHHGENPDVILQSALAGVGSPHVPRSIGSIVGEWDDPGRPDGRAEGHLAFAQEFLSNMEDGW